MSPVNPQVSRRRREMGVEVSRESRLSVYHCSALAAYELTYVAFLVTSSPPLQSWGVMCWSCPCHALCHLAGEWTEVYGMSTVVDKKRRCRGAFLMRVEAWWVPWRRGGCGCNASVRSTSSRYSINPPAAHLRLPPPPAGLTHGGLHCSDGLKLEKELASTRCCLYKCLKKRTVEGREISVLMCERKEWRSRGPLRSYPCTWRMIFAICSPLRYISAGQQFHSECWLHLKESFHEARTATSISFEKGLLARQ